MARGSFRTEMELKEAILQEKTKGASDIEIGQKYGVSFRYIEQTITEAQGLNIGAFKVCKQIKTLHPRDFRKEQTTVWSFKKRGRWATHSGEYRGNWSPYVPRNLILRYSKVGDLIVDYFCGAGTTAVECKLLGRKCIGIDINEKAIELAKKNIDFSIETWGSLIDNGDKLEIFEPQLSVGDARDLSFLTDDSVDMICSHPPYANIIHYTDSKQGDLSFYDVDDFLREMKRVARESYRVLKPGRICAILIGDMRKERHIVPLGFMVIDVFMDAGFKLRELIIKRQHNCKTTGFWYEKSIRNNFLLLAHEYLPVFEKPGLDRLFDAEEKEDFVFCKPTLSDNLQRNKIEKLETTTVWIFPENGFEECLYRNVIERYSNGKGYAVINFCDGSVEERAFPGKDGQLEKGLILIKHSHLKKNSLLEIEQHLIDIKKYVNEKMCNISKGGFLVIQIPDIRIDGYVEPLGKRIIALLNENELWLKEIIVVTKNERELKPEDQNQYLRITHQYLLVYEVLG